MLRLCNVCINILILKNIYIGLFSEKLNLYKSISKYVRYKIQLTKVIKLELLEIYVIYNYGPHFI